METENFPSPHHSDASRPSLGFPLGTAFLLIFIFTLSGILSCCYHRDKFRSFRRNSHHSDPEAATDAEKPKPALTSSNQMGKESLTVLMPGDQVPKFIAMPCPCRPPRSEVDVVVLEVQKSAKLPPHVVVPLS